MLEQFSFANTARSRTGPYK